VVSTSTAGLVAVQTLRAKSSRTAARLIVVRGRWSAGLALVYLASDRSIFERDRDLLQRRVSGAWPSQAIMQSGTCLVKREWQKTALFYAVARFAKSRRTG